MGSTIGKRCIDLITPHLPSQGRRKAGVVVIGAVKSDIHSIGKDLVAMQLRISGYDVHDMGIDVPTMKFIGKAREVKADIIGQSAFLVSTIPYTAELVKYLIDTGLRKDFKVIIGGTGTSDQYTRTIGADGWAKDCFDAVGLCDRLLHREYFFLESGGASWASDCWYKGVKRRRTTCRGIRIMVIDHLSCHCGQRCHRRPCP